MQLIAVDYRDECLSGWMGKYDGTLTVVRREFRSEVLVTDARNDGMPVELMQLG